MKEYKAGAYLRLSKEDDNPNPISHYLRSICGITQNRYKNTKKSTKTSMNLREKTAF